MNTQTHIMARDDNQQMVVVAFDAAAAPAPAAEPAADEPRTVLGTEVFV